jgi:hypothetical protein
LAIAGGALVVLLISIAFSKRKTEAMDSELPTSGSTAANGPATAAVGSTHG